MQRFSGLQPSQLLFGLSPQSQPVEDFYRRRDVLLDFDVGGGIPETWPRLLKALYDENRERELLEPEPRAA